MTNCPHCEKELTEILENNLKTQTGKEVLIFSCPHCHKALSVQDDLKEINKAFLNELIQQFANIVEKNYATIPKQQRLN